MNEDLEIYLDNMKILRTNIAIDTELFRKENESKYKTKGKYFNALNRHLEKKYSKDSESLFFLKQSGDLFEIIIGISKVLKAQKNYKK